MNYVPVLFNGEYENEKNKSSKRRRGFATQFVDMCDVIK